MLPSHSALGQEAKGQWPFLGPSAAAGHIGTLNDWDLISMIGEGGMGLVFLSRHLHRDETAALKVLRPELSRSPRAKAYFLKEARHMHFLHHAHILPIWDF